MNVVKVFKVALIDDVYYQTGYIRQWGTLKISIKKLTEHLDTWVEPMTFRPYLLNDIFDNKILLSCSEELNGYEEDIGTINDYDFIIKL